MRMRVPSGGLSWPASLAVGTSAVAPFAFGYLLYACGNPFAAAFMLLFFVIFSFGLDGAVWLLLIGVVALATVVARVLSAHYAASPARANSFVLLGLGFLLLGLVFGAFTHAAQSMCRIST